MAATPATPTRLRSVGVEDVDRDEHESARGDRDQRKRTQSGRSRMAFTVPADWECQQIGNGEQTHMRPDHVPIDIK
jgi:hypothetical protein